MTLSFEVVGGLLTDVKWLAHFKIYISLKLIYNTKRDLYVLDFHVVDS